MFELLRHQKSQRKVPISELNNISSAECRGKTDRNAAHRVEATEKNTSTRKKTTSNIAGTWGRDAVYFPTAPYWIAEENDVIILLFITAGT